MQAPKPAVAKIMDYLELHAALDAPPAYYYLPRIQQLFNGCEIPPQWLADTLPYSIPWALFNFTEDRFAFLAVIYLFKLIWPDLAACTEGPDRVTEEELEAFAGILDDLETALLLEDAEELQAIFEELSVSSLTAPRHHILRDPLNDYLLLPSEPTMESSFRFRSRLLGALHENWPYSARYECIDQEISDALAASDTPGFTAWWKLVNCKLPFAQVYDPNRLMTLLADYLMRNPRIETVIGHPGTERRFQPRRPHPADQLMIIIRDRLSMELLGTANVFPDGPSLALTIGPHYTGYDEDFDPEPITLRNQTLARIAHEVFLLLNVA